MLSIYLFIYFLIALFIFLLGAVLAQLLPTQKIFPKHFGHEAVDAIELRIYLTDSQCSILYPQLSEEGQEDAVCLSRGYQNSGLP